jgi:hypothetical protein
MPTVHSCTVAVVHSRTAIILAAVAAPSVVPSAGSSHRSIQRVMGHDKRKGKEPMVEPPEKKKTRTQKEAERAAMAARATDDQAAGHRHRFQIREPGARTEEQQGERVSLPPRRSLRERPRTRGGHTKHQDPSPRQSENRPRRSRTTAQDRAEDREVVTVVYRMDTVL